MGFRILQTFKSRRGTVAVWFSALATLSLIIAGVTSAQQRPRSTSAPTATATPTPQTPEPTPAESGPGRRIAPTLGPPPEPPVYKPKPTPTPDPNSAEISENDILKINADLVTLNVRVIDRNNRPINGISQTDFQVYEDGVAQRVFSFTEEQVPVIYGLAVDTSGSLRSQINEVIDAAKTIINSNKPGDETFLERFIDRDKIENLQDFTPNKDLLLDAVDNLYVEGGQTAVVDGVYLGAEHVAEYKKGRDDDRRRRALIVVTDGEDRASYYSQEQLFRQLREQDVQIYVIGFVNELDADRGLIRKSSKSKAVDLINRIASETGGRAFFPQSLAELPGVANEIVRDLRTQYVISYDPTNKAHDGTYRTIKVVVNQPAGGDKRIALTRSGRTANVPGTTAARPTTTTPPNNVRQPTPSNTPRRPPQ
jgi:Ca-activated chloride channel family protein